MDNVDEQGQQETRALHQRVEQARRSHHRQGILLNDCYSGKKKDHTVKNVLLVNALLLILFLSDTYGGRVHDKPMADATPYPLPAKSRLLQDLGFLAFTLPQVEILMPTRKPCGEELTLAQQRTNQALHCRRLRIEHVKSSVKRCRMVKGRIRLWKQAQT